MAGSLRSTTPLFRSVVLDATSDERRRHQRLSLSLQARFMREAGDEHPCKVTNISPGGLFAESDLDLAIGERIIIYVEELHRFEGVVARKTKRGFGVHFSASQRKINKTADTLTWLANRHLSIDAAGDEPPRGPRSRIAITLDGGERLEGRVIEMWGDGVRLSLSRRPALGARVYVGDKTGHVIERRPDGIVVQF